MTTLLLARHGETDWNAQQRWQGHADTPLNDSGREQARRLADEVERADVVYSSDLARARETAEIVGARLGLPVLVDERLRERGFGAWEGLTMPEIEERFGDSLHRWRAGVGAGADDAEAFDAFARRVQSFVEDVVDRHPDEEVLIVAHGGTIRVIHALASGLDYARDHHAIPSVANCALARYAFQEGKLAPID